MINRKELSNYEEFKKHPRTLTKNEAFMLIDDVIDTLIESGNGVSDEMLHKECDKLFIIRDYFINR